MKTALTTTLIFLALLFVACDNTDSQTDDTQTADESPDDTDTPEEPNTPESVTPEPVTPETPDPKEGVRIVVFGGSSDKFDLYLEVSYNGKTRTYNPTTPMVILLTDAEITTDVSYYCSAESTENVTFAVGYYVNGTRCVLQEMTGKLGNPDTSRIINQTFSKDFCKDYLTFDRAYEYDIDKELYNSGQEYNVESF